MNEQICAEMVNLWCDNDYFMRRDRKSSQDDVVIISSLIDFIKNDQLGKGLPRALAKAPKGAELLLDRNRRFCAITKIGAKLPLLVSISGQVNKNCSQKCSEFGYLIFLDYL